MKDSQSFSKKLGMIGIGLCVACCLFPIAAVTFGVGSLAAISAYMSWFGIITMILSVAALGVYYYRKRRAPSCDVNCACKEKDKLSNSNSDRRLSD